MAPHLIFFIPRRFDVESILLGLTQSLRLPANVGPMDSEATFQFVASRGVGEDSYLLLEYSEDAREMIEELSEWEKPSRAYKDLLLACQSKIGIHYRDSNDGKAAILAMSAALGEAANGCIVDNDWGCLLRLSAMVECINRDPNWSWERDEFPELPDVAVSEWREDD